MENAKLSFRTFQLLLFLALQFDVKTFQKPTFTPPFTFPCKQNLYRYFNYYNLYFYYYCFFPLLLSFFLSFFLNKLRQLFFSLSYICNKFQVQLLLLLIKADPVKDLLVHFKLPDRDIVFETISGSDKSSEGNDSTFIKTLIFYFWGFLFFDSQFL